MLFFNQKRNICFFLLDSVIVAKLIFGILKKQSWQCWKKSLKSSRCNLSLYIYFEIYQIVEDFSNSISSQEKTCCQTSFFQSFRKNFDSKSLIKLTAILFLFLFLFSFFSHKTKEKKERIVLFLLKKSNFQKDTKVNSMFTKLIQGLLQKLID